MQEDVANGALAKVSLADDSGSRTADSPLRRVQAAARRCEIRSPRLQAGEEAATDASRRSGRQKSLPSEFDEKHLWSEVCRPLRGLAPVAVTVPPPEGGGWGSFAACGGTDCLFKYKVRRGLCAETIVRAWEAVHAGVTAGILLL